CRPARVPVAAGGEKDRSLSAEEAHFGAQAFHFVRQAKNHFDADEVDAAVRAQVFDTPQGADGLVIEVVATARRVHDRRQKTVLAINSDHPAWHVHQVLHYFDGVNSVQVRLKKLDRVGRDFIL